MMILFKHVKNIENIKLYFIYFILIILEIVIKERNKQVYNYLNSGSKISKFLRCNYFRYDINYKDIIDVMQRIEH